MASRKISLLLAGGGTGGHLWPGVVLAKAFQKLVPGSQITFFVPGKPVDFLILSSTDFPVHINPMRSFPSSIVQYPGFFLRFFQSYHCTLKVFRRYSPNLVVGLGGYGSFSAGYLAHRYSIPMVMLESNRIAGKTVRWISKWCEWVYTPGVVAGLPGKKIKPLGIPVREDLPLNKEFIWEQKEKITILVMGGSLGARYLNQLVYESLIFLRSFAKAIQFIHLCGPDAEYIREEYHRNGIQAQVLSFSNNMGEIYQESDLIVCRAGGSTLAEITAIGMPAILIPFDRAADGHQKANALAMEKAGAALVFQEKEINGQLLADILLDLMQNKEKLSKMSHAAKTMSKPNAAKDIALDLCKMLGVIANT